jgi:hypothetical protein
LRLIVMAIGLTNNASRVIIGRGKDELHIWDPMYSRSLKKPWTNYWNSLLNIYLFCIAITKPSFLVQK